MNSNQPAYSFLQMPANAARGNLTNQVTSALRQAIVTLRMKPGEDIDKIAICNKMNVSRFPVSEALARLQTDGLVDILPQRGSRVSLLKISNVREFMLIRRAVEAEIARTFAHHPDPDALIEMQHLHDQQIIAVKTENAEEFHRIDFAFHTAMLTPLHFFHVQSIITSARSNLERTNRLLDSHRRFAHTLDEHQKILDTVTARDPEAAASAMRDHMDAVMESVMHIAAQKPHLFADGELELAPGD